MRYPVQDVALCLGECKTNNKCFWFSYDSQEKLCYLNDGCKHFSSARENFGDQNFISGMVSCPNCKFKSMIRELKYPI